MTLPGEFKPRSSKQCAGSQSGFVYTVRDRSHLSASQHQHDPDLCGDDTVSSDIFSDDPLAQGTSKFECSFASGFDVDANSAMGKLCAGRRRSVAKTCSAVRGFTSPEGRGRSCWDSWQQASSRIAQTECTHLPELLVHRANQWASMDVCDKKEWRMRRHHELCPLSCIGRSHRGKGHDERKEERYYHDQPESRTDRRGAYTKESEDVACPEMRPRTSCLQHRFGADLALPWMESRRNTVNVDPSVPRRSRRPWKVEEYQPYRKVEVQRVVLVAQEHSQDETLAHRIHLL